MNYNKLEIKHYIIEVPKINERQLLLLRHIYMTIEAAALDNKKYYIDIDLFEDMNESKIKELLKTNIEISITDKNVGTWQNFHVINEICIEKNKIFFRPSNIIRNNVLNTEYQEVHTFLNFMLFNGIRHKQTLLFLNYIIQEKKIKFSLALKELKKIMEMEEKQYIGFSSFKNFILNRAISEINEKTAYHVEYTISKKAGKKVEELSFSYRTT